MRDDLHRANWQPSLLPTRFVPVSDPRPVVALAGLEAGDVDIAGGTATFTLSGEVADAIADIIPNNLADIATVRVLVDGEEYIAPTALEVGDGGAASFWRRHPFKGLFEDLEVEVAAEGAHVVTVETSANAAGSCGQDSLLLSFYSAEETFFGGTNFVATIYIATNLTNTVADTLQYYHGAGEPYEEDPWLAETAVASLVFTGRLDEVDIEIDIGGFGGLTTNVDSFAAEMRFNISTNYQPVYSNLFVETSATSGLFRSASAITVGRADLTVAVRSLDGSLPGTCVPVVERVKGPADLLGSGDCTLEFMGETFELEAEDGWFYPKGGSPRFWVATDGDSDPENTYLISYEPNGTISEVKQSEAPPEVKLLKSGTVLFNIYATLLNIDLKGYEAWRAANDEVPRTEEEQPGFLITAKVDDVGGVNPLEAKIVAAKLAYTGTGGLTRWLRFSDPTKVALTRDGNPVEIPAPSMELQIDGATTADAAYEIFMSNPTNWAAKIYVTVEYFIRDKDGNKFPGGDKVQLLRPVVVAIGDSLTFGYMAYSNKAPLTANWPKPDKPNNRFWEPADYPNAAAWSAVGADRTNVTNQGWRGYLDRDLAPAGFIWEGEETSGHGPKHCGYSGAKTGNINARMDPKHKQYRDMPSNALETDPCYSIVIYFIGANDCNGPRGTGESIYQEWLAGFEKICEFRADKGKTLILPVTIPMTEREHYGSPAVQARISGLNPLIQQTADPKKVRALLAHQRQRIVDIGDINHQNDDDGLHFLSPGYEAIASHIQQRLKAGLAGEP